MAITLSERAANRVQKFLDQRGKGVGLRLGVRTSGCSGMAYTLEFVDETLPDDIAFVSYGVTVLIDPKSLTFLEGTELDFVDCDCSRIGKDDGAGCRLHVHGSISCVGGA